MTEAAVVTKEATAAAEAMESNKIPRPMKTTQQAHQYGRNGQTKAGPVGGNERGATWEHITGPMDSIHQNSITQVIIVRGGVMFTRRKQQSTSISMEAHRICPLASNCEKRRGQIVLYRLKRK